MDVIDRLRNTGYVARAVDSHPQRERQADGSWALAFDGVDDYAGFPWETIPQFSAWRMSFEVWPTRTDRRELVYAARYTESNGNLWGVYNDRGRILVGYAGFPGRTEWASVLSPARLSTNGWNRVELKLDGQRLSLAVNGTPPVEKPCLLPGKATSTSILGGIPGRDAFFAGRIRNLAIDHAISR